jgi:hypothetical protein
MKNLAHWISNIPQHQRDDDGPQKIVLRALCALEGHGTNEIDAEIADGILGLNPGTTRFFNHNGAVPATALIEELTRRAGCPLPEHSLNQETTSLQINREYAAQLLESNPPND